MEQPGKGAKFSMLPELKVFFYFDWFILFWKKTFETSLSFKEQKTKTHSMRAQHFSKNLKRTCCGDSEKRRLKVSFRNVPLLRTKLTCLKPATIPLKLQDLLTPTCCWVCNFTLLSKFKYRNYSACNSCRT